MLVEFTITKTETETREVELPYIAKNESECYRINEDGSYTKVYTGYGDTMNYCYISLTPKGTIGYDRDIQMILSMAPSSHNDYMEALEKVRARIESASSVKEVA